MTIRLGGHRWSKFVRSATRPMVAAPVASGALPTALHRAATDRQYAAGSRFALGFGQPFTYYLPRHSHQFLPPDQEDGGTVASGQPSGDPRVSSSRTAVQIHGLTTTSPPPSPPHGSHSKEFQCAERPKGRVPYRFLRAGPTRRHRPRFFGPCLPCPRGEQSRTRSPESPGRVWRNEGNATLTHSPARPHRQADR